MTELRDDPARGQEERIIAMLGIPWSGGRKPIRCPMGTHKDVHPSWRWATEYPKPRYCCSCGSGDIYDLIVMMGKARDLIEARDWVRLSFGQTQDVVGRPKHTQDVVAKRDQPPTNSPPPPNSSYAEAPKQPRKSQLKHPEWGEPSEVYLYHNPVTRKIAEVRARYEGPLLEAAGKRKEVIPWIWTGERWHRGQMPGPRPWYGALDLVSREEAPVLVVEGEGRKFRRACELFADHVVVSGSGGCKAFAGMDYTLLKGRRIVCWPDNDDVGRKYATGVCRLALENGAIEARVVDVPEDWPRAWDLGDEPPSDSVDLRDMLECANLYQKLLDVSSQSPQNSKTGLNGTQAPQSGVVPLGRGPSGQRDPADAYINAPMEPGQVIPFSTLGAAAVNPAPIMRGVEAPTKFKLTRLRNIAPTLTGMWLIKGLLPARGLCTVFGEPGCGKSFLTLNMALHVAAGRDYAARRTKQGRVVYIAAEGQGGFRNRAIEAAKALELDEATQFDLIEVAPNLGVKNGDADELIAAIEAQAEPGDSPVVIVVVDTTSQTMGGENENLEGMAAFIVNANHIAGHFSCLAIAVHHVGKADTATPRGWSGLHGANDTEIKVTALENPHTASIVKQKDGEPGMAFSFDLNRVEIGVDEDGDPVTTCVVGLTSEIAKAKPEAKRDPLARPPRRSVREFDAAFNEALQDGGEDYFIDGEGPVVRALYVHQIRPYFAKRWATDETDKNARNKKAREAFKAVLKSLPPKYHTRESNGGERIWRNS